MLGYSFCNQWSWLVRFSNASSDFCAPVTALISHYQQHSLATHLPGQQPLDWRSFALQSLDLLAICKSLRAFSRYWPDVSGFSFILRLRFMFIVHGITIEEETMKFTNTLTYNLTTWENVVCSSTFANDYLYISVGFDWGRKLIRNSSYSTLRSKIYAMLLQRKHEHTSNFIFRTH